MRFRNKQKFAETGFQIAPMIDVIFILLSFFVTTQIFSQWETEIDIKLPTAQTGKVPERMPGEIIINILEDGQLVVNGRILEETALAALLDRIVEIFEGQPVLIRADKDTAYEHVIKVLDLCRRSDIWNVSFATSMEDSE